jgi:serine/threonine protein phosphatase PrpC
MEVGIESVLGGRPVQQDSALSCSIKIGGDDAHLFGVFDGHGPDGHKSSEFSKSVFPTVLASLAEKTDLETALKEAFLKVDQLLIDNESIDSFLSGTTAVIAVIMHGYLHVASVGDSRAVLVKNNATAIQITRYRHLT